MTLPKSTEALVQTEQAEPCQGWVHQSGAQSLENNQTMLKFN